MLPEYLKPVNQNLGGPTGSGIQYIRKDIPKIEYPPFRGTHYTAFVPDTLDLAERARLGIHGMTSCTDRASDYEIYGNGWPSKGVLTMAHSYHDHNGGQPKWIEALCLLREASGSTENMEVDRKMMETLFHMLGPDGLLNIAVKGSSWSILTHGNERTYFDPNVSQVMNVCPSGRGLMAMSTWYMHSPDPVLKEAIEHMVDGFAKIAVYEGDYCWFRERYWDGRAASDETMAMELGASVKSTFVMGGLAYAYKATGYEPAADLGQKLACYLMGPARMFDPEHEGHFYGHSDAEGKWKDGVHFHGTTHGLLGILELGLAKNDQHLIDFARKAYDFARSQGITEVGWFPEGYPASHARVEGCHVGDMTIYAARLSAAGVGDYWEDVEHYTRNQLQSAQVTDPGWLETGARLVANDPNSAALFAWGALADYAATVDKDLAGVKPGTVAPLMTADHVAERNVGTYLGLAEVNGQLGIGTAYSCCTGNANRAFYHVWHHILTEKDGKLRVNLLLNRASKWADVNSYLPYQGKLEIAMKASEDLAARIPSWVTDGLAQCRVNGKAKQASMDGRYLQVGQVHKGDKVEVEFPLLRETREIHAFKTPYTIDMKGFNVVEIWPKNNICPFYGREDYRQDTPRFREIERFAAEDEGR